MFETQTVHFTHNDGAWAVEPTREPVEPYVLHGQREQPGSMYDAFYVRTRASVRIKSTRKRGRLRSYAGVYRGKDQLSYAIVDTVIKATSGDSCQTEIEASELPNLNISICTIDNYTPTNDPAADIELGTHGIAIDTGDTRGWMHPTLPIELG